MTGKTSVIIGLSFLVLFCGGGAVAGYALAGAIIALFVSFKFLIFLFIAAVIVLIGMVLYGSHLQHQGKEIPDWMLPHAKRKKNR